jgi:hypothetical protein
LKAHVPVTQAGSAFAGATVHGVSVDGYEHPPSLQRPLDA